MADEPGTYETKTVRILRGTEARAISKLEAEGWEVVSQTPGNIRSEIVARKPKSKPRIVLYSIVGVVVVAAIAVVIVMGVIGEKNNPALGSTSGPASNSTSAPSDSAQESSGGASGVADSAQTPLTVENNEDFAALVALGDYCDPTIATFSEKYRGQELVFDGNVNALNNHGSYETRFDILFGYGDFSETSQPGPAFQMRDVNIVGDMNVVGPAPESMRVGDNLHLRAVVGKYEPNTCLFLIEPIETSYR